MNPFEIEYSKKETIALGIKHENCRRLAVRSFSRHNTVFDAYIDPVRFLPIFFTIPCFIRILDVSVYRVLEAEIISEYRDHDGESLPPLLVYGDDKLFEHPLIIDAIAVGADYCRQLYRRTRRRAKREALCS